MPYAGLTISKTLPISSSLFVFTHKNKVFLSYSVPLCIIDISYQICRSSHDFVVSKEIHGTGNHATCHRYSDLTGRNLQDLQEGQAVLLPTNEN